jgi:glycerol-3-phosphate dehydrogenase
VLVVGGGVTGAGILLEASRRGLRALLVERGDFASGTSSRSSKLVHGGLRYLKEGKIGLARESVREREELLRDAPGLVEPIHFLMPHYPGSKPGTMALSVGLAVYDAFAGRRLHRFVDRDEALRLVPALAERRLRGAHVYLDATTDDARLVLRLLRDSEAHGATALNYVAAATLIRHRGRVVGARLEDVASDRTAEVRARVVVNATGVFADALRGEVGERPRLRPLRGSHLLLHDWRLPLAYAVAFSHPGDGRPVFAYPWLGMTLVGTTDLDHRANLADEPSISPEEVEYLLAGLHAQFPSGAIDGGDVVSTYAGVRPVVGTGKADPSREGREHVVWREHGLITVTGGKLTTFRPMALETLRAAMPRLRRRVDLRPRPVFTPAPEPDAPPHLGAAWRRRLAGLHGARAQSLVDGAAPDELSPIEGASALWAELRFAAREEHVMRLDDLLLRRTRVGLSFADGGEHLFARVREICAAELGWNDERFDREAAAYRSLRRSHYGVPA